MQNCLNVEQAFEVGNQKGFQLDVERFTKILRLIHCRTLDDDREAEAVLEMDSGFIKTIDMVNEQSHHSLLSVISFTGEMVEPKPAESFHSLFECCGYQIIDNKRTWYKEFVMADSHAYYKLAVLSVGFLSLLFKYKPGDLLSVSLFVPGPDIEKLRPTEDYPVLEMHSHLGFRADYHTCLAGFHNSMCFDAESMSDTEITQVKETINRLKSMIQTIPEIIAEIHKLGPAYSEFLYETGNIETELSESLITLCCTFRERLFD